MFNFFAAVTLVVIAAVCLVSLWDDRRHQQSEFKRAMKVEITPVERNMYYRKFAVARDLATSFLKTYPYSPEIYGLRAAARAELGDTKGASEDCDKALMMKPGVYWIYFARGLIKLEAGAYAEALSELEMSQQCGLGDFAPLYGARAKCEAKLGQTEAALRDCKTALSIDEHDEESISLLEQLQRPEKDKQKKSSELIAK